MYKYLSIEYNYAGKFLWNIGGIQKMGIILSIYSENAFKEYLLPAVVNEEYSIILEQNIFNLNKDMKLNLEISEYRWSFVLPAPKELNRRPLFMVIGPSLTMTIPMLLGCGLLIYSASLRGTGGGAFMFTGIATAVSSAFIGVMWALINLNYEKKNISEMVSAYMV